MTYHWVRPLCFAWLTPSDTMRISTSRWKNFYKELENENSIPGPTLINIPETVQYHIYAMAFHFDLSCESVTYITNIIT